MDLNMHAGCVRVSFYWFGWTGT